MNDPMSILMCLPDGMAMFDPDPALTEQRDVRLVDTWADDTAGIVGWSDGGWEALRIAAAHPDVPRLAIVSLPFVPDEAPFRDFDAVVAKTLLLFGTADERTGSRHGTHWQRSLPNARLEMVPGGTHDLLVPMWKRVLSHLAPRRKKV